MCIFKDGRSIDTTFTFATQSGLIQTARSGDLDPFVLPSIMERKDIGLEQALTEASREGGLFGISGVEVIAETRR